MRRAKSDVWLTWMARKLKSSVSSITLGLLGICAFIFYSFYAFHGMMAAEASTELLPAAQTPDLPATRTAADDAKQSSSKESADKQADRITKDKPLVAGYDKVFSQNQAFYVAVQDGEGKLCVNSADGANLWCSSGDRQASSKPEGVKYRVAFQDDGNMCAAPTGGKVYWCSHEKAFAKSADIYARIGDDGSFCTYLDSHSESEQTKLWCARKEDKAKGTTDKPPSWAWQPVLDPKVWKSQASVAIETSSVDPFLCQVSDIIVDPLRVYLLPQPGKEAEAIADMYYCCVTPRVEEKKRWEFAGTHGSNTFDWLKNPADGKKDYHKQKERKCTYIKEDFCMCFNKARWLPSVWSDARQHHVAFQTKLDGNTWMMNHWFSGPGPHPDHLSMKFLEFHAYHALRRKAPQCCYSLVPEKIDTLLSVDYPITGRVATDYESFVLEMLALSTGAKQVTNLGYYPLRETTEGNWRFWPWLERGMTRLAQLEGLCDALGDLKKAAAPKGLAQFGAQRAAVFQELEAECAAQPRPIWEHTSKGALPTAVQVETAFVSPLYNGNIPEPVPLSHAAFRKSWTGAVNGRGIETNCVSKQHASSTLRVMLLQRTDGNGLRLWKNKDAIEAAIEVTLKAQGLKAKISTVFIDTRTPAIEQAMAFCSYHLIVSSHSSQLANLVFSENDISVIEMQTEDGENNPPFLMLGKKIGAHYQLIQKGIRPLDKKTNEPKDCKNCHPREYNMMVDLGTFKEALEAAVKHLVKVGFVRLEIESAEDAGWTSLCAATAKSDNLRVSFVRSAEAVSLAYNPTKSSSTEKNDKERVVFAQLRPRSIDTIFVDPSKLTLPSKGESTSCSPQHMILLQRDPKFDKIAGLLRQSGSVVLMYQALDEKTLAIALRSAATRMQITEGTWTSKDANKKEKAEDKKTDRITKDKPLVAGYDKVFSQNQAFYVAVQDGEGKLCVNSAYGANLWCSGGDRQASSKPEGVKYRVAFQDDGNMCAAPTGGKAYWCSHEKAFAKSADIYARIGDDGSFCTYLDSHSESASSVQSLWCAPVTYRPQQDASSTPTSRDLRDVSMRVCGYTMMSDWVSCYLWYNFELSAPRCPIDKNLKSTVEVSRVFRCLQDHYIKNVLSGAENRRCRCKANVIVGNINQVVADTEVVERYRMSQPAVTDGVQYYCRSDKPISCE